MIEIKKSQNADTRSCDYTNVSKEDLEYNTKQHISDVQQGIQYFIAKLEKAQIEHDKTKLTKLDDFYNDFITGFEKTTWWEMHKQEERHHISSPDGIRDDVDLVDVIEHVVDCVMAGLARTGTVYPIELPVELLQRTPCFISQFLY
jgi:hypothetical protein